MSKIRMTIGVLVLTALSWTGAELRAADPGKGDDLDAILGDIEADKTRDVIREIVVDGLTETDGKAFSATLKTKAGDLFNAEKFTAELTAVAPRHPAWVVGRLAAEPSAEGGVKVRIPVCYRNPEYNVTMDKKGALSFRLGADRLLTASLPDIYFFDEMKNGATNRPSLEWIRAARLNYDPVTNVLLATYAWGTCRIAYAPETNGVGLTVTLTSTHEWPIANLNLWLTEPVAFPATPKGYGWSMGWGEMLTGDRPDALVADYGRGAVVLWAQERPAGVNVGFNSTRHLVLSIASLAPGATSTTRLRLRCGPGSAAEGDPYLLAREAYDAYRAKHPWQGPEWPDRRPVAALHPSSAHLGSGTFGPTRNPRGWWFEAHDKTFEVETEAGRADFRKRMMDHAREIVRICREADAQGVIVWSLEGQEYPHTISYVGSPDKLAEMAPEMDAIADEWFGLFKAGGLRTGLCVRPSELLPNPNYDPKAPVNQAPFKYYQKEQRKPDGSIDQAATLAVLDRKISYAKKRWGCTIFYVDSNADADYAKDPVTGEWKCVRWGIMPYEIFLELGKRHPDCLIVPEHETLAYYSCSVPLTGGPTSPSARALWPKSFSVNLMQEFNPASAGDRASAEACVRQGDILIMQGNYNDPITAVIREIYSRCGPAAVKKLD